VKAIVSTLYRLYQRKNGIYYLEHKQTREQVSLRTKDPEEAQRLLFARNEAVRDTLVSREVGMAYLASADPGAKERDWKWVMDQVLSVKKGETLHRWKTAVADKAFDLIREAKVVDTRAEHFLAVMERGTVSTNVYLRRIHNFALDMGWLPRALIVRRQWPAVKHKKKRAITWEEHCRIVEREGNAERRDYYELLWQVGASQGDLAHLKGEDVFWRPFWHVRFFRAKTGSVVGQRFGEKAAAIFRRLPEKGYLFPYLATVEAKDRANEFRQRCEGLGIKGVTLHSYRYAWAQRGKKCGYPERFAQLALGHNSKAVHEHYAGVQECVIPSLEEYEERYAGLNDSAPPTPPVEQSAAPVQEAEQPAMVRSRIAALEF
jgi:integrase